MLWVGRVKWKCTKVAIGEFGDAGAHEAVKVKGDGAVRHGFVPERGKAYKCQLVYGTGLRGRVRTHSYRVEPHRILLDAGLVQLGRKASRCWRSPQPSRRAGRMAQGVVNHRRVKVLLRLVCERSCVGLAPS